MNMNHFNSVMHNNIKLSKQKERMLEKLRKRKEERERMQASQSQSSQPQEFTHSVFKGDEKMEKSKRVNNKKKKRRKKKKKKG